jgi:glucose-6-phosphate-specific signal transduction histidine kinase
VLGIAVCLFLSIFALDSFGEGKSLAQGLADFALHVAPMVILLVVVGLSWRWPWVGGVVFTALALTYATWARQHPSWIAVVAVPLLVVGLLFLWSWAMHRQLHGMA